MKKIFLFICLISLSSCLMGQPFDKIYQDYDNYKDSNVFDRRFKHADIMKALEKLPNKFPLKRVGTSVEGRSINMVQVGNGPVKVLLWSQMHGNEPTATMAILDLFNFFAASDEYDGFRNELMQKCSFYFIPMLNPDGAEKYQRRNAMDVDLNRDAQRLQNPESICLKSIRDSLEPDWGFNLHDQNRYYSAGAGMPYTASFSFLAPAFNRQKDLSPKREDAMQLIGHMNRLLQKYIPNKVGQYDDTFEPRAFGDNIQKWGTRTILIEVGGLKDDPEKQYLRKLHFMILLKAFQGIA
ncbi:MAG: M14 family zinc carboxypeptidase, partial [Bacteroidota bacterium]